MLMSTWEPGDEVEEGLRALRAHDAPQETVERIRARCVASLEARRARSEASRSRPLSWRDWLEPAGRRGLGRVALFAIATLRRDESVDLLLSLAREEEPPTAREALAALASITSDAALYERARAAVDGRPELRAALARAFGRGVGS